MDGKREQTGLEELIQLACRLGAGDAVVISAGDIPIEDHLAELCKTPGCENYGQGAGCPPHVSGPSAFRELLKQYERALVFKIEVPSEALFSSERQDIFRLLHEISAAVEQSAVRMGYGRSKAFAGGSCKQLFCEKHAKCRVLSGEGACRNPDRARPSMSGFGINVSNLVQVAGWTMNRVVQGDEAPVSMGTLCGLVLID